MKIRYIFIIFCFMCSFSSSDAQIIDEDEIRNELIKRGVDNEEVKRRLIAKGFDPDNIDPTDSAKILELQNAAEEIIKEIEAETKSVETNNAGTVLEAPSNFEVPKDILTSDVNNEAPKETKEESVENDKASIYGQQLYREKSIRFYQKSEYINTPSDYVLGPGDIVSVSIWGQNEANLTQQISDGGYVKFSKIPRITLSGLKLRDAKQLMQSRMSRFYTFNEEDFELKVTATRNINIFITGEVGNVGSYNISAVNTAVNALAAAGGPTDIGSVRNIKIVSPENGNKSLDIYKFLKDPQVSNDFFLSEGDYIVVPVISKVVEIKGAINRPYKYELLPKETLKDLIDFAGGLKVNALKKNIKITRYDEDRRVIINLDLNSLNSMNPFDLENGDVVEISEIRNDLRNAVTLLGAVENSGEFAVTNGMRISDLMNKAILADNAILDIAYLSRLNDNGKTVNWQIINIEEAMRSPSSASNLELRHRDKITVRKTSDFFSSNSFEILGAVNSSGVIQLDQSDELKVSDAIFLANGLTPNATDFGYIIRNLPGSFTSEYIPLSISSIMANPASAENINLRPGDVLQVYDKGQYLDETFISVQGSVREPNRFKYDESLTLKDVLLLSKGLTIDAANNKIDIYRLEFKNNNKTRTLVTNVSVDENYNTLSGGTVALQPFDQIIVRKAPEFEKQREVFVTGEVKYPGKYYLMNDNYTIVDLIKDAGGLTGEAFPGGMNLKRSENDVGYIIVDLDEAMNNPGSTKNIILQLGDSLYIPKMNNLVSIEGAVNKAEAFNGDISSANKINFVYDETKGAKYYIEKSGGFRSNADKSSVSVKYPNGEMHKTKKFLFFKRYPKVVPGSTITVGFEKVEVKDPNNQDEDIDWGRILSNSIAQATAILSLILLIQNVD
ncbi:MAG: SLBB domain-containing protein [Saprospiraceae bacterium]|nr:SLBB domain-containing protein [Saprospiraceae bacterium]